MKKSIWPILLLLLSFCQEKVLPPIPILPIPDVRQIAWQELEYYGFVHFNMNTFSDREWGFGDEKPEQFNPSELDVRQWARIASEAGMKGLIITAKHHDGFVLWPSAFTDHSVKNSSWKDGKGDLIRELADACAEYGLKFGIYYSPWDRNHPHYGKPEYIIYMRNQLTELLTNYGEIFEVWFDGANGGDGWYGGANETRTVDKFSYYDWPTTHELVRKLQPGAMMFSDAGPDVRWVGNEHGFAYETTWSNLMRDSVYAGMPQYSEKWAAGQENGTHWVPAESDVSIRPCWYYHAYEDHKVKTLPQLLEIFYNSIGRNSSMLINFPVDRRGLIHENDEAAILALGEKIKADFAVNLAAQASISASTSRGKGYQAENLLDSDYETYWSIPEGEISAYVELDFGQETAFNRLLLQEYTSMGQRQKAFSLEKEVNGSWEKIAEGTTIGYKRILRFPLQKASKIRINFEDGKGIPVISELGIYHAPALLIPPSFKREKSGEVTLITSDSNLQISYSLDGGQPTLIYSTPISLLEAKTLKAISFDPNTEESSAILEVNLDVAKAKWTTSNPDSEKAIDENPATFWTVVENELILDLGESHLLKGFTYLPMQARYPSGFIQNYEFQISTDGKIWTSVAKGEFANIANNPILQEVRFDSVEARFIRLKAIKTTDGNSATFAELGIVTR